MTSGDDLHEAADGGIAMLLMKACPRCQGDVAPIEDFEGDLQLTCVQCGYTAYVRRSRTPVAEDSKPVIATLRKAS